MRIIEKFEDFGPITLAMLAEKFSAVEDAVDLALDLGASDIETEAVMLCPTDAGELAQSIKKNKVGELNYEIGSHLEYAASVEFGSRPHWAPKKAIEEWAMRKGLDEAAAEMIWISIGVKGTQAHPFLRPAFQKYKEPIIKQVIEAIGRGLQDG